MAEGLENAYGGPIWTKFSTQTQNDIQMTKKWSNPEAKVKNNKNDGHLFPKPEVLLTQPEIDGFRRNLVCIYPSTYTNELFYWTRNRKWICDAVAAILKKCIWRHSSARGGPISIKFGTQSQIDIPMTNEWSKSKPEVKIQYGGRLFSKTGNINVYAVY